MRSLTRQGFNTTIKTDWDPNDLMTGEERYPVIGTYLVKDIFKEVTKKFKGLQITSNCVEKNVIGMAAIGVPCWIALGSFRVWNKKRTSSYGFDFNPPYELHSWLIPKVDPYIVIDFSLPGVIIRALKFKDSKGRVVTNRTPSYLAGVPPPWLEYSEIQKCEKVPFCRL